MPITWIYTICPMPEKPSGLIPTTPVCIGCGLAGEFGHRRLNQITRYEIIKFHGKLKDEGLAPATCDHYVKLLKHSLNLAIDWGLLNEKNPAARVPLFNASNVIQNIPNDEQVGRLLELLKRTRTGTWHRS